MMTSLLSVFAEPAKVFSVCCDNSASVVYLNMRKDSLDNAGSELRYVRLTNPNRIYFDVNDAVLVGEKQQLVYENIPIKEIRLAQFDTNPNIVRTVITFEENFDTSKIKLHETVSGIVVETSSPLLKNDYFSTIYSEVPPEPIYSRISVESQTIKKAELPVNKSEPDNKTLADIQEAFGSTSVPNTEVKTPDSVVSVDLSSKLKLRTRCFINQYNNKGGGLLVSGLGQLTAERMFYLKDPGRAVIDLPNTYLDRQIRNREIPLCPGGGCKDTAKIGQFEYNKARIVITSDKPDKYIPVYSQDLQSLYIADTDRLDHTVLTQNESNINKAFVKKYNSKTSELILSFTSPIVQSVVRTDNSVTLYMFNVKSYNEPDLIKTFNNTPFKGMTFSLLPQVGVKAVLKGLSKNDKVNIDQSVDSKALRLTVTRAATTEIRAIEEKEVKKNVKNKVVLDAGHGGSDYGAIREGINEKDITLDIVRRVDAILRTKGYKTALTRNDDTYVSLEDRVSFCEAESPEIFVSVHVNSAVSTNPHGIETHWYHEYSKPLAEIIHKHLISELPKANDRGLFKSMFYVINHTTVPAVLCEIGFLSNDEERNELISESRKQKTAKAIAEGIMEYIKGINKNK